MGRAAEASAKLSGEVVSRSARQAQEVEPTRRQRLAGLEFVEGGAGGLLVEAGDRPHEQLCRLRRSFCTAIWSSCSAR
ncbi:hypothetical protein ACFYUD_02960 [Nocardia tengchongensis]|uniref:hypothetical protein n=1 Tax=Nocardia tengchongensis TaxID=2055889 RepID=UPI003674D2C5